jgi:hypothetical protein
MAERRLEREIENECVRIAEAAGVVSAKLDKAHRSYPDRCFFLPNGCAWIVEFKRPGERPRPQQTARLDLFAKLQYPVDVIDSVAEFRSTFAERLFDCRAWWRQPVEPSD